MYVYTCISLSYYYLLCSICKCTHAGTHLPTARQYKVLFLPSTAVSMAAGISFHAGALGVAGSI